MIQLKFDSLIDFEKTLVELKRDHQTEILKKLRMEFKEYIDKNNSLPRQGDHNQYYEGIDIATEKIEQFIIDFYVKVEQD